LFKTGSAELVNLLPSRSRLPLRKFSSLFNKITLTLINRARHCQVERRKRKLKRFRLLMGRKELKEKLKNDSGQISFILIIIKCIFNVEIAAFYI